MSLYSSKLFSGTTKKYLHKSFEIFFSLGMKFAGIDLHRRDLVSGGCRCFDCALEVTLAECGR